LAEIIRIHLRKNNRNPKMFDAQMTELTSLCNNFTGAEIEVWVAEAITRAFSLGHSDIQLDDLRAAVNEVTPIYKLQAAEIQEARRKATERGTKNASRVRNPQQAATPRAPSGRVVNIDNN
jgi:ATP-dependent 26S proteasome regulatory subunit